MHRFSRQILPKDTNRIVDSMMNLSVQFTKITFLFSPLLAQYASKYDEVAEGIQFISQQFMKRIVIDRC